MENSNPTSMTKIKRVLVGKVVSDKMDKTVVVKVERTFTDRRFHKTRRTTKTYKVHDAEEKAKVGDIVEFYEGRPISKTKYMYLARIVGSVAMGMKADEVS